MHENKRKNYHFLVLDKKVCKGKTNICFTKVVELVIETLVSKYLFSAVTMNLKVELPG